MQKVILTLAVISLVNYSQPAAQAIAYLELIAKVKFSSKVDISQFIDDTVSSIKVLSKIFTHIGDVACERSAIINHLILLKLYCLRGSL